MIVQFSLANFKSVHLRQTLSFRSTSLVSEIKEVDQRNIFETNDMHLLKTIGMYGANASGKSNIIKGFSFFRNLIINSLNNDELIRATISPFKQSTLLSENSGYFEVVLILDNKKYRYGFTLDEESNIKEEWLYGLAQKKETNYFLRHPKGFSINPLWFQEGDDLPREKLRSDVLFLSFCASYNGVISNNIKDYFASKVSIDINFNRLLPGRMSTGSRVTNKLIETGKKDVVLRWMKEAGLLFSDVQLKRIEYSKTLVQEYVILSKNIYNANGETEGSIEMNLNEDESEGTKKFYAYIGRLHKKFEEGGLFVSDEIDSNFHPSLLRKLVSYFNNPTVNVANAQLLFTSHDTNLMNPEIMRRDQFYFTEKSNSDETILYSLSDLKGVRNNADFARQYLAGVYGALPILGNFLEEKN